MGSCIIIMKFFVVIPALVAAAMADADPLLLGAYPYAAAVGAYGYAGYPYAVGLKSAPCVNAANVPVPCNLGKKKREAEADPLYLGAYPYSVGAYAAYIYGAYPYAGVGVAATNPTLGHAVALTGFGGAVHSSLVGVCTNNAGVQVPC